MVDVATFRQVAEACSRAVFWQLPRTPAQALAEAAEQAAAYDLEWDRYGSGGAVEQVETELVEVFGTEAAAFFPSGTMAQQSALRVWCDRVGTTRVALPDLSHLLLHESDGPRLLHDFRFEHLTTGPRTPTVDDLAAVPGQLAAVLVELPLRDAGCLLPEWDDLVALADAARERGAAFHLDGARVWEAQASYDRPLAEIAGVADTMYVSFYKGLGGLAGAALVGPEDVLAEARLWRHRMGGTLFHLTAEATTTLAGLRRPPDFAGQLAWARSLAALLPRHGITPHPAVPHVHTFRVHAAGEADEVNERALAVMRREDLALTGMWRAADEPGRVHTELTCSAASLDHDPARVAALLGEVVKGSV
ncbi:beta-eliminating lyase-related protein [Nocardioides aestuarii]|uniref:Threonine aldolase family protein n=1 Tax=Nocardioides aestuarii TaxID=252231 RepID=A0ABW4TVQ9_9ACTN